MKRGLSTGKPTKREAERIVACKEGPCVYCARWSQLHPFGRVSIVYGCDFHHFKSGNIRRGHRYGVGACVWHHRGIPPEGFSSAQARDQMGPSLMDGSRLFHETYGSDDELLEIQDELIGWAD